MGQSHPLTDMRRYRRQTELRLAIAVVVFLTIVGNALVWLLFGAQTALGSLLCSVFGALLFGGLYALLVWLQRWSESRE